MKVGVEISARKKKKKNNNNNNINNNIINNNNNNKIHKTEKSARNILTNGHNFGHHFSVGRGRCLSSLFVLRKFRFECWNDLNHLTQELFPPMHKRFRNVNAE